MCEAVSFLRPGARPVRLPAAEGVMHWTGAAGAAIRCSRATSGSLFLAFLFQARRSSQSAFGASFTRVLSSTAATVEGLRGAASAQAMRRLGTALAKVPSGAAFRGTRRGDCQ